MQGKTLKEGAAKTVAIALFFAGIYFVAQAYTMAFHGIYIDCFSGQGGCGLRPFTEPSLPAALYGTFLAVGALVTFYLGVRALRWTHGPVSAPRA